MRALRATLCSEQKANKLGRPYDSEIERLAETYEWAKRLDLKSIQPLLCGMEDKPLLVVGSGGSLSAAHLAASFHERRFGHLARACTPLELGGSLSVLSYCHAVLILSAGGRNPDVLRALQSCIDNEVSHVGVLCGALRTPLARLARSSEFITPVEFSQPIGKDGFLAVNSLLAFAVLLSRLYFEQEDTGVLPDSFSELIGVTRPEELLQKATEGDLNSLMNRETLIVLYGSDTKPAAVDIESKFTEAALGRILLADFRNFGHGRHHWLAKRGEESGVLALCSPADLALANKTLELLPAAVPSALARFEQSAVHRQVSALVYAMVFAGSVGKIRGIDPGRPGVPDFGRKIYHLKARLPRPKQQVDRWRDSIVRRKIAAFGIPFGSERISSIFFDAADAEIQKLTCREFGTLTLDYDGTMCSAQERFDGPSEAMSRHLLPLLDAGVVLGIATGRGRSVRADLRRVLSARLWPGVWIAYYNGGEIGRLDDDTFPASSEEVGPELQGVKTSIEADGLSKSLVDLRYRFSQITLTPKRTTSIDALVSFAAAKIKDSGTHGVRAVSSTHSVDIIASGVSKLNLLEHFKRSHLVETTDDILCLGDRGCYPGNDFELLAHRFALSVDEVSADLKSGWNLAPPGLRGTAATLHYLSMIKVRGCRFTLDLSGVLKS